MYLYITETLMSSVNTDAGEFILGVCRAPSDIVVSSVKV